MTVTELDSKEPIVLKVGKFMWWRFLSGKSVLNKVFPNFVVMKITYVLEAH